MAVHNMNIEKFLINRDNTIEETLERIDANGFGVAYVEAGGKIVGVVTDGDIRRYFLKEQNLKKKISYIMNKNFVYIGNQDKNVNKKFFKEKRILSVPVLNEEKEISKIIFSNGAVAEYHNELNVPVVIIAGGKGTRLRPYTNILPKPLIPINEKTITEHILDRFASYACEKFYMIVNYKKNLIKAYFQDPDMNYNIEFIDEEQFMGTGGGLRLLLGKIQTTFILTNCDILIDTDYKKILDQHCKKKNILTMVCAKKTVQIPYGTVEVDENGNIVQLLEKPKYNILTNTGFYVIEPEFLKEIPENEFIHITDIIQKCLDEGKQIGTYLIDENSWLDMGQFEELEHMENVLE